LIIPQQEWERADNGRWCRHEHFDDDKEQIELTDQNKVFFVTDVMAFESSSNHLPDIRLESIMTDRT
jgi:hypothetical protein